jgi:predicted SAM-dependent methyltransferase
MSPLGTTVHVDETDFHSVWSAQTTPRHPLKVLLSRILPAALLDQIKFELQMFAVRLKTRGGHRRYAGRRNLLVNVGAGNSGKTGWVNVDGFPGPGVNCLADARTRLPFDDNSVRGIFSEHFFEHIDYVSEAPTFLRECFRTLHPGGVLRLIVPDLEPYFRAYAEGDWDALARIRPLDGNRRVDHHYGWTYNTQMELVNFVLRQGQQHKFAYDFATMEFLMKKCGFTTVIRQSYGTSVMPELCIDAESRASESLYVEAVKSTINV